MTKLKTIDNKEVAKFLNICTQIHSLHSNYVAKLDKLAKYEKNMNPATGASTAIVKLNGDEIVVSTKAVFAVAIEETTIKANEDYDTLMKKILEAGRADIFI